MTARPLLEPLDAARGLQAFEVDGLVAVAT